MLPQTSCPLHARLNFEGQFLPSLEGAVGDQSHNIMKLGYPPYINAFSCLLRKMAESCMRVEAETPILLGIWPILGWMH